MREFLQERFQLTQAGAEGLEKAAWSSFAYYIIYMLPMMFMMIFLRATMEGTDYGYNRWLLGIGVIVILIYAVTDINYRTTFDETYKESANLRIDIADILKKLPLAYFSKHDISDLAQTVMADVATIEHALAHAIGRTIGYGYFFVIMGVLLLLGDYRLGICVLGPLTVSALFLYLSKKAQIKARAAHYAKLRSISEDFQTVIEMSREIKSYGRQEQTMAKIAASLEEAEAIQMRADVIQSIPISAAGWITKLSIGMTTLVGLVLLLRQEVSLLYLIGYIVSAAKISEGLEGVYMFLGEIFYLDARIQRIRELRNTATQKGWQIDFAGYDLVLENVEFSYSGQEQKVIKNVSFTAKQNEITAVIGPSGCGKTTLLKLLCRLYDYDRGKILLGGHDIKMVDTECLFVKISVVFQEVLLFNTSILENIRIGKITASDEEVRKAAKLAGCEEIIQRLPAGIQTIVGENGIRLSGGERQRISIARAILKDAPVILLDEIAASLDVENEGKIQKALNKLIKNKTVVIISHRLKSIQNVNKIVLLEKGRIAAMGTHQELLVVSPLYRSMLEKSNLTDAYEY